MSKDALLLFHYDIVQKLCFHLLKLEEIPKVFFGHLVKLPLLAGALDSVGVLFAIQYIFVARHRSFRHDDHAFLPRQIAGLWKSYSQAVALLVKRLKLTTYYYVKELRWLALRINNLVSYEVNFLKVEDKFSESLAVKCLEQRYFIQKINVGIKLSQFNFAETPLETIRI